MLMVNIVRRVAPDCVRFHFDLLALAMLDLLAYNIKDQGKCNLFESLTLVS